MTCHGRENTFLAQCHDDNSKRRLDHVLAGYAQMTGQTIAKISRFGIRWLVQRQHGSPFGKKERVAIAP
jgi:hypothetical protein